MTQRMRVISATERSENRPKFAKDCVKAVGALPKTHSNQIFVRQLIRSASSIPANYIEAQESLSRKDFIYRIAVCRKEAKESVQWLRLLIDTNTGAGFDQREFERLMGEASEFVKVFSRSLNTAKSK